MSEKNQTMSSSGIQDAGFLASEKFLDERMFWNLQALLHVDDAEERDAIFRAELPPEVMDPRFSFIRENKIPEQKSIISEHEPSQEKSPKVKLKPTMKEIFDGSYQKQQKKEAIMKKPSLLLTLRVNTVEESPKPISVEEEVEQEIVSRIVLMVK